MSTIIIDYISNTKEKMQLLNQPLLLADERESTIECHISIGFVWIR